MTEANQTTANAEAAAALHPRVIAAQHNNLIDVKEVNYGFRKQKDEATGVEKKSGEIRLMVLERRVCSISECRGLVKPSLHLR